MFRAILTSLAVGVLLSRALLSGPLRALALDRPNERSLHSKVVPRTGGLAIIVATSAGFSLQRGREMLLLWGICACLGVFSFVDDRSGLPVWSRLAAQFGASSVAISLIGVGQPGWWMALALLSIVWMTNLFNFMDGADGLAGGMAAAGFSAYAAGAAIGHDHRLAALSACIAASSLAFLTHNVAPARIFMGDAGSTALGFAAGALGFYGHAAKIWPLWFPALAFLPFIADATVTLLRRAFRRERLWRAHRDHYYQHLIRAGWTHSKMARVAYALMIGTAGSGVIALLHAPDLGWPLLAFWLVTLGLLMRAVDVHWAKHEAMCKHRECLDNEQAARVIGGACQRK